MIVLNGSELNNLNVFGTGASVLFKDADEQSATINHVTNLTITNGGLVTIEQRAGPTSSDPASVLIVNNLDLGAPSGVLDLKDNGLIVDYDFDSPHDYIRSLTTSAYADGAWTGNGITSSSARSPVTNMGAGYAQNGDATNGLDVNSFLGQSVDTSSVLVRYTYYGDTDLNGRVNLPDFNRLAANFGQSNRLWVHGDSTYDGQVTLPDFNRLAANFGASPLDPEEGGGNGPQMQDPEYTYDELWEMLMNWPRP